jgi:hypothetical protein
MALEDYLLPDEKVVNSFDELFLTTERLIQYYESGTNESIKDLHYMYLESVEYSEALKLKLLVIGVLLGILAIGVFIFTKELALLGIFLILSLVFFIAFTFFRDRRTLFRGQNTVIEIMKGDKKIITDARRLQRQYLRNTVSKDY